MFHLASFDLEARRLSASSIARVRFFLGGFAAAFAGALALGPGLGVETGRPWVLDVALARDFAVSLALVVSFGGTAFLLPLDFGAFFSTAFTLWSC